jgi:CheY-like chemotaxis protein
MSYILLVEDEAAIRTTIAFLLEREGYRVQAAANGREALRLAGEEAPALIVTDVSMPVMDGLELLRRLPEVVGAMPPVLVLSAVYESETIADTVAQCEFLPKPFEIEDLLERVARLAA